MDELKEINDRIKSLKEELTFLQTKKDMLAPRQTVSYPRALAEQFEKAQQQVGSYFNKIILDYNKLSNSHYSNLGPLICGPSIRYSLFPPT